MAQDPKPRKLGSDVEYSQGTNGERPSVHRPLRNQRPRMYLTPTRFRLIAFSTVSGLTIIALIGGFMTGDMQPFHTVLSFLIGVVSGIMSGHVDTNQ